MNTDMPQKTSFVKLYKKHEKCLKLGGFQPKTIEAYTRAIRRIGNYFDGRIENLTADQLLDYFTELLDDHSWSTVKLDLYGLKFFYSEVLNKPWQDIPLVKAPKTSRIPDILPIEQLDRLFAATNRVSYWVFFFTAASPLAPSLPAGFVSGAASVLVDGVLAASSGFFLPLCLKSVTYQPLPFN